MSSYAQVLTHVVENPKALKQLQRSGITSEHFGDYAKVWTYLCRMKAQHGSVPSMKLVHTRFPGFEPVKTKKRDFPMLVVELQRRKRYADFLDYIDIAARDSDDPDDFERVVAELQTNLNGLTTITGQSSMVDLFSEEAAKRMMKELRERRSGGTIGIPTGLKRFDYVNNGLQNSRLYVTMARTGVGKSWINLLFVANAVIAGRTVGLFPLEMSLEETALRLYTIFSQRIFGPEKALKNLDLQNGRITMKKVVKLLGILQDRYAGKLYVADMGTMTDPYTVERVSAETSVYGFDMTWIDYITLMKAPGVGRDGQEDHMTVKALSGGCKRMAMQHKNVVGVSAQVNREAIRGRHFLPRLEHIAFGDSIGHDADGVLSMNRKGQYLYYSEVKNRTGPEIPKTRVLFNVDQGQIEETQDQEETDDDDD